jgi:tRNA(fMet)-specific endonuclease VapC
VKYLLDTNLCVAAMRNHPLVLQRLSALAPGECVISSITAYELFTGIEKCSDPARERPKVERLLQIVGQLPFDSAAASEAARIRGVLEKTGQSIGPYDMLLAGHAMSLQLVLVTNNTSEFVRVTGLALENWQMPTP